MMNVKVFDPAFRELTERYFVAPQTGLVYSFLDMDTMSPPKSEFFDGAETDNLAPEYSLADQHMYENFGMCTGSYMQAEVLRYRQTGAADALAHAERGLAGIRYVYELGKQLAPGFFPKIYGGRFSRETSTDQLLYACCAMAALYPQTGKRNQESIEEMLPTLVRFWLERDYRYHFFYIFGDDWQWPLVRFPALLLLAYRFSGEEAFRQEYERLLEHTRTPEHVQLALKRSGRVALSTYEQRHNGYVTFNLPDRITMDTMQYDLLLRYDPNNPMSAIWKENLALLWEETTGAIAPDGWCYTLLFYDAATGFPRRVTAEEVNLPYFPGVKSSWSTMVARAGMQILAHCPELCPKILPVVELVLEKIGFYDCRYYGEAERLPPARHYLTRLYSGDAVTNNLWCAQLYRQFRPDDPAPETCGTIQNV